MEEKRRYLRFVKFHKTRYLHPGTGGTWQECIIIDVSRWGMKVRLQEQIDPDTPMYFVITLPGIPFPLNLRGTLTRIEKSGGDFTGGIALNDRLDDETFVRLLHGHRAPPETPEGGETQDPPAGAHPPAEKAIPALCARAPFSMATLLKACTSLRSSVSLYSILLFFSLPVVFIMVTGYLGGNPFKAGPAQQGEPEEPTSGAEALFGSSDRHARAETDHPGTQERVPVLPADDLSTVTLKDGGGSLYFLAFQQYQRADETIFDLIHQANPALTDLRQIADDQQIRLPAITPESFIHKISTGTYQVHIGTFENMDLVGICSDQVISLGKSIIVEPHRFSERDIWYRVLLGTFTTREDALNAVASLSKKGIIYIPPGGTGKSS